MRSRGITQRCTVQHHPRLAGVPPLHCTEAGTTRMSGLAHPLSEQELRSALRGTAFLERGDYGLAPRRLPEWTRAQAADSGLHRVADHTTGVYLNLETAAQEIELQVQVTRLQGTTETTANPAIFTVLVDGTMTDLVALHEGTVIETYPDGTARTLPGRPSTVRLQLPQPANGRPRTAQVWFPHSAAVEIRRVSASAPIKAAPSESRPRWTHYGSSISHGRSADTPLGPWPVVAARALGCGLQHLGFGGQAVLDPSVARVIRDTPADFISLKIGINVVNQDAMRRRSFIPAVHGFLDTIREGQPDTPVLLISPIYCPFHEENPGPTVTGADGRLTAADRPDLPVGALTLRVIREILSDIAHSRADPALHYLDGQALLGVEDLEYLHVDDIHPDTAGYALMGDRFTALARENRWIVT